MGSSLKKYQLNSFEKLVLWLNNYELGEPFIDSIRFVRYYSVSQMAENVVYANEKVYSDNEDFLFTLVIDEQLESELKSYLYRNKNMIIKHINKRGYNIGSYLYQFYLQYLYDQLSIEEKRLFLEKYIIMLKDIRGSVIANEKLDILERKLNLNSEQ